MDGVKSGRPPRFGGTHIGSREIAPDFWAGVAPASGEYTILVYLMGKDKDAGATRTNDVDVRAE
jgi:hypothetical protein